MTRVIIHSGFHKTGTTTLQRFLEINDEALAPYVRVVLKPEMEDVLQSARDFSNFTKQTASGSLVRRQAFRISFNRRLTALLLRVAPTDGRILLISSEELSGRLPGRDDILAYDAAAPLAREMRNVCKRHFGDDLDITFLCTTRNPERWLRSAYSHLLQFSKFTMSEDEFTSKYARAGDLDTIVEQMTLAVQPFRLHTSPLESTRNEHFGPASVLVNLLELPADAVDVLQPAKSLNKRLGGIEQTKMLELNSTIDDDVELSHKKRRFLRKRRNRLRREQEKS